MASRTTLERLTSKASLIYAQALDALANKGDVRQRDMMVESGQGK